MNAKMYPEDEMDPRLQAALNQLRPVPPRQPEVIERGRARFLAQVDSLNLDAQPSPWERMGRGAGIRPNNRNDASRFSGYQSFTARALAALVTVLFLLAGGAGVSAYAAQSALPGDSLYPLKTGLEQTRLNLAADAAAQAALHLDFAGRRLDEMVALIAAGRFQEVGHTAAEFEAHLQQAIAALEVVAAGDPAQAGRLAEQIAAALSRYGQTLGAMLASAPDGVRPAVEGALIASQNAGQLSDDFKGEIEFTGAVEAIDGDTWVVAGRSIIVTVQTEVKGAIQVGDLVKVHATFDDDGRLVAREIEFARDAGELQPVGGQEIEFNGVVEAMSVESWTISGRAVAITQQTEIKGLIGVGDFVKVHALVGEAGRLTAREIEPALEEDRREDGALTEVRFTGRVEAIASGSWTISGRIINVDSSTEVRDLIDVGDLVEVRALQSADGSLTATRIELEDDREDDQDAAESEVRFSGRVESIAPGVWLVSGRLIVVTLATDIRDFIQVGDFVEVRAILKADGALVAERIERDD